MTDTDANGTGPLGDNTSSSRTWFPRLRNWMLLDANRYLLASTIVAIAFFVFAWLGYSEVLDLDQSTAPMLYLFSTLVGGNITLITIVVTINQLILARELRSPRELQTELDSAEKYRDSVEEETDRPGVPEQPDEFLRLLLNDTRRQVLALDSTVGDSPDSPLEEDLERLTANLQTEFDATLQQLETSRGGVFSALTTILDADFSARLNHSRWIRHSWEDSLSESQRTLLDELEKRIEQLDIARQYFKTIYIKQELADVSKVIMYSGLLATMVGLVFLVSTGYLQRSLPLVTRVVLVPIAIALSLVPLSILITHVVRIATITRRTAAITPFLSPGE